MDKRIDPCFYQPKYRNFYSMLKTSKYQVVMLADLIKLIYRYPSCYGFSCYDTASDTRVPFLQGEDIDLTEISHEKLIFIEKEISAKYPKTILKEGDLIFSVRGTIGKVAMVTRAFENSNISPNLIRLSLNTEVNSHYVEIVLKSKIGQSQIDRLISGGVQPTITKQDILSIEIPLPHPNVQSHLVETMQSISAQKKQKEQEADTLLSSIDDYVLAELGIVMPAVEEKRCFVVHVNEIAGRRVDSHYYQSKFRATDQIVGSVRFDVFDLGVLINDISSGITPKVDEDYYTDSSGIPFLRVQNVTNQGIDLSDTKFIKKEVHKGILKRSQLKKDDLVFTITGRIGSVAVVPDNFEGNINQHSVRFHLKQQIAKININPHYVAVFLNSELGRSLAIREVTGGTRPALDYKALKAIKIVLPPFEVQNEIVAGVKQRLTKERELRQEALKEWETAKTQFEEQLLSGEVS